VNHLTCPQSFRLDRAGFDCVHRANALRKGFSGLLQRFARAGRAESLKIFAAGRRDAIGLVFTSGAAIGDDSLSQLQWIFLANQFWQIDALVLAICADPRPFANFFPPP